MLNLFEADHEYMRADGRNNKIVVVAFLPPLHRTGLHRTVETQVTNCPSVLRILAAVTQFD